MVKQLNHLSVELKSLGLLWITLNNPVKLNAISYEMIDSLTQTLIAAESDSQVKVIILTGEGKAFCSGGDIQSMKNKTDMFEGDSNELRIKYSQGIQRIPKTIEDLSKPLVAMVNGAAIGAGCDLSMMCDLRIGSEKSVFGETFAKLGLVPGDGGSFFLTRVVGYAKAMQMTLLAETISGEKALHYGLLNDLVPHEQLSIETEKLATKIALLPGPALQMAKKSLKNSYLHDLHVNLDLLAAYQGIAQRTSEHELALNNIKLTP